MTPQSVFYIFASSLIALFPVINPIGNVFIINDSLKGLEEHDRRAAARKIVLNALLTGVVSLAAGHLILLLFGLAVPVIQVAGGLVICRTGWLWLTDGQQSANQANAAELTRKKIENQLFYPLSFPITIGPGTISVIFTLMATANIKGEWLRTGVNYMAIALAIAATLGLLYTLLVQGHRLTGKLSHNSNMIIGKLVAFITFCIGIQIVLEGISKLFDLHLAV